MILKRHVLSTVITLLLVALLAVACGDAGTPTGSTAAPTPTATTASAPTPTPTTASSSGAVVMTASATVDSKSVTILTDAKGLTLYYRTSDTATSVCSGGCAQAWPPLIFSGTGTPASSTSLPGTLDVSMNVNGNQVTYNGHPLYTFASDTAAGQTSGQGVGGVWFVATTDLAAMGGSGGAATPTPTSNGY